MRTTAPDFAPYVAAIIGYGSGDEIDGALWYVATALCTDSLCHLPISTYKELADFVENHQSEIASCIAGASA